MDKGGLRGWSRKGTGLWTRVGWIYGLNKEPTMWAKTTKNRNRSTSIAVLLWCHRLANLILPATVFRIKFDSYTHFDTRCN